MWDKDLVNAPNLKVSWLWLVDPPQNQQDCTFFALCPDWGKYVQSLAFQKISEFWIWSPVHISSHSKPHMIPHTRLLKCFVLITLRWKIKHLRSLVHANVQGFEWLEIARMEIQTEVAWFKNVFKKEYQQMLVHKTLDFIQFPFNSPTKLMDAPKYP